MIKKFEEFVNEGLLDMFSGDGCKNLETVCSAFAKRLSKVAPIKFKQKLSNDKIVENELNYSKLLRLQYISADDDLSRVLGSERLKKMAAFLKLEEDVAINWKFFSKSV